MPFASLPSSSEKVLLGYEVSGIHSNHPEASRNQQQLFGSLQQSNKTKTILGWLDGHVGGSTPPPPSPRVLHFPRHWWWAGKQPSTPGSKPRKHALLSFQNSTGRHPLQTTRCVVAANCWDLAIV